MRSKIAAQMYTIREFVRTEKGLAQSLQKLARIGYTAVQLSAVAALGPEKPEVSAEQARRMLDDNGIKCIATHRSWDELVKNTQREIDFHHALGCDFVAIGSIPGIYSSLGATGYRSWTADAKPVIARLNAAGLRFGYHNHAFEFERCGSDRKTFFDILAQDGAPDMMIEMDVYWVEHAGFNPVRVIEQLHGRLPVVHVKDKEIAGGDPVMAPVGEGNLDWPSILHALEEAGVEWYAVEQDECRRDPFDCLRSSFEFLTGVTL
jgi:sugar phosphate isomerase/epimerase